MSLIHGENWDGVTAPATPTGWNVSAFIVTATSGATPLSSPNMLSLPAGSAGSEIITYATQDGNSGNVTVQGTVQFGTGGSSGNSWGSVVARGNSATLSYSSSTFYELAFSGENGDLEINKVVAGTSTNLASVSISSISTGVWYRISLTLVGASLSATAQRLSDNEWLNSSGSWAAAQATAISISDSSISGQGYTGWAASAGPASATFGDDWSLLTPQIWTLVQRATNGSSGSVSSLTATFSSAVTPGNLIVVQSGNQFTGSLVGSPSCVDSKSNTYTQYADQSASGTLSRHLEASRFGTRLRRLAAAVSRSHSRRGTSGNCALEISEYSAPGFFATDGENSGSGSSGTSLSSGSITTTHTDLVVCAGASLGLSQTWTAGSGFATGFTQAGSSSSLPFCAEDQLNVVPGSITPGMSDTVSSLWVCAAAAFSVKLTGMTATEGGDVFAASVVESASASLSKTESHDTLTGSGHTLDAGSLTGTESHDTLSSLVHFSDIGVISYTNVGDSFSGSAKFVSNATIAKTEAHDAFVSSGHSATSASMSRTEAHDVFAATATGPSASITATEHHDTFAGVSGIANHATLAPTERHDAMSSFATVSPFLRAREGGDHFAGGGAATGCVGTMAVTNASDSFAASGGFTFDVVATLRPTETGDSFVSTATQSSSASMAAHEHGDSFAGSSALHVIATLGPTEGGDQFAGGFQSVAYHIYWNSGSGPIDYTSAIDTTAGLTYTTSPLAFPATYQFGVRAFYVLGGLEETNVDAICTIVLDGTGNDITNQPFAPTGLRAFPLAAGTARVEWTEPPSSVAKQPTGFNVYSGTPSISYASPVGTVLFNTAINNTFQFTLTGLANATTYIVGVRAFNSVSEEQNTATVSVTGATVGPTAVVGLVAIATS